jgi:hypothetical protein
MNTFGPYRSQPHKQDVSFDDLPHQRDVIDQALLMTSIDFVYIKKLGRRTRFFFSKNPGATDSNGINRGNCCENI